MNEFKYTAAQCRGFELIKTGAAHIMFFGGSRSGKTFLLCCAMIVRAVRYPGSRHVIIRRNLNSVRTTIGMDTMQKALRLRYPNGRVRHNKSDNVFQFSNGSEIWLVGLDNQERADKILGKEFATIYFNECSELDYNSVQTALTRLAQNVPGLFNRVFYDCNPPSKTHWTYKIFIQKVTPSENTPLLNAEQYVAMKINPDDNRENLPDGYIENTLSGLSNRQKLRFLHGDFADDTEGALWKQAMIDACRVIHAPEMRRIVVAIDPAVTCGPNADETGIVAAGIGADGHFYVLDDQSLKAPAMEWCRAAVALYHERRADRIVGEVNNGGDLIESLMRQIDPNISYRQVRASRGKQRRAEPVVALYEKKRVHHVGYFSELENEMTGWSPVMSQDSPDRMDALVWALTELSASPGGDRFIVA